MTVPSRILLAIADPLLCQTVAEHLAAAGLEVTLAGDADAAMALATGRQLIVIDETPPDSLLCCRLRAGGIGVPVLLLTATQTAACGHAAATVAKPLRLPVLLKAITGILARPPEISDLALGPWRFDGGRRLLVGPDGRQQRLTDKEAQMLCRLARAQGAVVPREVLLAEIWGYSAAIATHTLETHIYRLRRKIEADPAGVGLLVTEPGGYRLIP